APRRAALPRKPINWTKTTSEMMRMYAPPRVTTSASAPKAASIGSAKTKPNRVSGIDRKAPRTRLSLRTWSASSRRFAPIPRATRAIVPVDTEIMTLKKRKMNWPPKPTAATAAGASAPRDPTMITSTVVVRVWRMFVTILQALRKEPLDGGRDVLRHEARLEFVRDDRARAARGEDACEALRHIALRHDVEDVAGNVDGLGTGARFHGDDFVVGNHAI